MSIQTVNRLILEEFWNSQIGRLIGKGMTRCVYEFPITNDKYIVKVEDNTESGDRHFQNVREWNVWNDLKEHELGGWLAPCHWISESGKILIMRQTRPTDRANYPDKIPAIFNDVKFENFGMIGDRFVCHDYGIINFLKAAEAKKGAMVTAHWYSSDDRAPTTAR